MMLGIETQLLIYHDIRRINKIADYQKRLDELIAVKQKIISSLYDDLDELFAEVNLTQPKAEEKKVVENRVVQLSIAFDEDQQTQMDYELLCDNVGRLVGDLYWYDKEILMLYIELGNYRAIEKKTGIPFVSAYKTVQRAIKQIKQKVLR
jgi:hypothetical protein